MGFKYSTVAGVTVSLSDIEVAPHKEDHVEYGKEKAEELKTLRKKRKTYYAGMGASPKQVMGRC